MILRGSLTASQRPDVVVDFNETATGQRPHRVQELDTGRDGRQLFLVLGHAGIPIKLFCRGSGTLHVVNTPHRFIFHAPIPLGQVKQRRFDLQQVCLQVGGTQVGWASGIQGVSGGTTCKVGQPDWLAIMPAWWVDLMLPIWGPDPGPDEMLSSGIVAHISAQSEALAQVGAQPQLPAQIGAQLAAPAQMSAQSSAAAPGDAVTPSIIHFANDPSATPLPILGDALLASKLREAKIPVIVVLPRGLSTRRELRWRGGSAPFPRGWVRQSC